MSAEPESYQVKLEREIIELKAKLVKLTVVTLRVKTSSQSAITENKKLKKLNADSAQMIENLAQELVKLHKQIGRSSAPASGSSLRRTDIRMRHHRRP